MCTTKFVRHHPPGRNALPRGTCQNKVQTVYAPLEVTDKHNSRRERNARFREAKDWPDFD
jgi:hypothetical protein